MHERMAFTASGGRRLSSLGPGDRAVLYVARGAFHNPTRDRSRLAGLVEVTGIPVTDAPVVIAGRRYPVTVAIRPLVVLPERAGPPVADLVADLKLVCRPEAWGMYFRTSPIRVSDGDFTVLEAAVRRAAAQVR